MSKKKGGLALAGVAVGATKLLQTAFAASVTLVLANRVAPKEFGLYVFIYSLVLVISIPAKFGVPQLLMRETAKLDIASERAELSVLWRWSAKLMVVTTAFAAVAVFAAVYINTNSLVGSTMGAALLVALATTNAFAGVIRGLHRNVLAQLPENIFRPGLFLLIAGIMPVSMIQGREVNALIGAQLLAASVGLMFASGIFWKLKPPLAPYQNEVPNPGWLSSLLPLGVAAALPNIMQNAELLLVGWVLGSADVAYYRVASQGFILLCLAFAVAEILIAPRIARLWNLGETRAIEKLARKSSALVLGIVSCAAITFYFVGHLMVAELLPPAYGQVARLISILVVGGIVRAAFGHGLVVLAMTRHEKAAMVLILVSAVTSILLGWWLSTRFGVIGIAYGSAAGTVVLAAMARLVALRLTSIRAGII